MDPPGKTASQNCSEVRGSDENGRTLSSRIDRLMVPFPGVPLRKD